MTASLGGQQLAADGVRPQSRTFAFDNITVLLGEHLMDRVGRLGP